MEVLMKFFSIALSFVLVWSSFLPLLQAQEPAAASVTILMQPLTEADIYVDGRLVAEKKSATLVNLTPGTHKIEAKREGMQGSAEITVEAGERLEVTISLGRKTGQLKVVNYPLDASIYLDDEFKGTGPMRIRNLQPGEYTLRVEKEGYQPYEVQVWVNEQTETEEVVFLKSGGTIPWYWYAIGGGLLVAGGTAALLLSDDDDDSATQLQGIDPGVWPPSQGK